MDNIKFKKLDIRDISEMIFESAAEGLIVADKSGIIHLVNPRLSEMFGYEEEEILGQKVELLIPETYRKRHVKQREKYSEHPAKRPMGINMDLFGKRKDESTFPVEISLNHFTVDGEMMAMALVSDITERKKAEDELRDLNKKLEQRVKERTKALNDSQQLYRMIARNFPNGVINVFDKELNYIFVEGMEMYKRGIKGETLVGTSFLKNIDPSVRDKVRERLMPVFEGHNTSFELTTGSNVYMFNAVALPNTNNTIDQILVVTQNITNLKKAEKDIQQALEKEKHLNELKSRFVSMASHEFRTPLTTMMNSISLLSRYIGTEDNREKQLRHISRIKTSVHHLANILNDFLSLDKLEEGKVEIHCVLFNMKDFCEDVIEDMESVAKEGQKITHQHQGEEEVYLDKQMLKNIFNNLLSNAIKYSGENDTIRIGTIVENKLLTISVEDRGIGIPEGEQGNLFERFFRANNALNIQGTGLGLNIVKKYMEIVDGEINFVSKLNEGTTFILQIPMDKE